MKFDVDRTLVIEDSSAGVTAGLAAEMQVIQLASLDERESEFGSQAERVGSAKELLAALMRRV